MPDILPDSRMQDRRQFVPGPMGSWLPIFCANCGADGGLVPEEGTTFVCWLCRPCADTLGEVAGLMLMPDELYWQKLKEVQLEAYGRFLTEPELLAVVEAGASPLATLIKQGRA